MERYTQGINQDSSPSPIPKTLHQLCLRTIHDHFSTIPSLSNLSTFVLQQIQHFMMQARMIGSRLLNDANVHKLLVPNLEELNLAGFWVTDQPFVDHYNCPYLTSLNLTDCLPLRTALKKICIVSPNIRVMLLKGVHQLDKGSVLAISQNCVNLQVLTLSCGKFLADEIGTLFSSCTKLTVLKLYRAALVNPAELAKGISELPNLEKFSIEKCNITDDTFPQILKCKNLRVLKIGGSPELSGTNIKNDGISALKKLKFDDCPKLVNISKILASCPEINSLHLRGCKKVSNETIVALRNFPHILHQMENFSVHHNHKVNDEAMWQVTQAFSGNLKHLDLTGCKNIVSLWNPENSTEVKSQWQNLERLVLNTCNNMQLFTAARQEVILPNLAYLDLSGVTITDESLIKLLTPMVHLHTLNLRFSNHLTGAYLLEISQANILPSLLRLQASKSIGLREMINYKGTLQPLKLASPTLKFLEFSYTHPTKIQIDCPDLEILDFSGNGLTAECMVENIQKMPKLTNFWAKGHANLTPLVMKALASSCPNMQVMDISNSPEILPETLADIIPQLKNIYRIYYGQTVLTPDQQQNLTQVIERFPNIIVH